MQNKPQHSEDMVLTRITKKLLLDFINKDLKIVNPDDRDTIQFLCSYRGFVNSLPTEVYEIRSHEPNRIIFTKSSDKTYILTLTTEAIGGCVYKLSDLNKITDVHIVKTHDSWIPTLMKDAIDDYFIPDPELQEAIHKLDTI